MCPFGGQEIIVFHRYFSTQSETVTVKDFRDEVAEVVVVWSYVK